MGSLVNPTGWRLGFIKNWTINFISRKLNYSYLFLMWFNSVFVIIYLLKYLIFIFLNKYFNFNFSYIYILNKNCKISFFIFFSFKIFKTIAKLKSLPEYLFKKSKAKVVAEKKIRKATFFPSNLLSQKFFLFCNFQLFFYPGVLLTKLSKKPAVFCPKRRAWKTSTLLREFHWWFNKTYKADKIKYTQVYRKLHYPYISSFYKRSKKLAKRNKKKFLYKKKTYILWE